MAEPSPIDTSEAEEMYLITVARAVEEGQPEPVPASVVARDLSVSAVSANQMIKKLAGRGLVVYTPYHGVRLTDEGRRIAASILRRRRLWGVFLSDHLGLAPQRADIIACDMEHITPDDVADILAEYLDDPKVGPRGRTIPVGNPVTAAKTERLSDLGVGETRAIAAVEAAEPTDAFLAGHGLLPGSDVTVLGIGADGDRLVSIGDTTVQLVNEIADRVLVEATR